MKTLAKTLNFLLENEAIAYGKVSPKTKRLLQPLFDTNVLLIVRSGTGRKISVRSSKGLENFSKTTFPEGLDNAITGAVTKANGVLYYRDSKQVKQNESENILLRSLNKSQGTFSLNGQKLPVKEWTHLAKTAVVRITRTDSIKISGSLAFVENEEVFYEFDKLSLDYDFIILTGGRLSQRLLSIIRTMSKITHFGDYDPVGLDEFRRIQNVFPHAQFFVPSNIEKLFSTYSKHNLVSDNRAILQRLRKSDNPTIRKMVGLMDENNGGVEQEILLISKIMKDRKHI